MAYCGPIGKNGHTATKSISLFGEITRTIPGSCKSEAAKCGLALFGAHESHCLNNQSTPSYLFKILSKTTIPVVIDDITARAADTWEELFIDAYNGTSLPRLCRMGMRVTFMEILI